MTISAEKRWVAGCAFVLIALTTLPYVLGYASETQSWKFSGFLMGVEDGNSYIGKMMNGSSGEWLFRTPYTSAPQNGLLAFLPYILLGNLASGPGIHIQLVMLFQVFRWVGICIFAFGVYEFCALFLEERRMRRLALILISCGGGLGWLFFTGAKAWWGANLPLEFYSPESFGFLEIFTLPHLAVARGLLLLGLVSFLRTPEKDWTRREMSIAATVWFSVGFFQPLHNAIGCLLAVLYAAIRVGLDLTNSLGRERRVSDATVGLIKRCGVILTASAFWIIYNLVIFAADPYGRVWMQQNVLLSPPFWSYLLAYGWLLPPAAFGVAAVVRAKEPKGLLLAVWLLLLPALAYAPTNVQRRLVEGEWIAVVLLALTGYQSFFRGNWKALISYSAPAFLPTIFLFSGALMTALRPAEPAFLPQTDAACFKAISQIAPADALVLADRVAGNSLPAWANVRTLVGHGPESAGKDILEPQVDRFFRGTMPPDEMSAFLANNQIRYVLFREANKNLPTNLPVRNLGLVQVFSEPGCLIYSYQP